MGDGAVYSESELFSSSTTRDLIVRYNMGWQCDQCVNRLVVAAGKTASQINSAAILMSASVFDAAHRYVLREGLTVRVMAILKPL